MEVKKIQAGDAEVLVKYFNPVGPGTWLITEADQLEDEDWLLMDIVIFMNGNGALLHLANYNQLEVNLDQVQKEIYILGIKNM